MNKTIFFILSFVTVALMAPVPQDEEIEGDAVTQPSSGWRSAWQSVKSLLGKLSGGESGGNDSILSRLSQAASFYRMLTENPQQLVEKLKEMVMNALRNGVLTPGEARNDWTNIGNKIRQASRGSIDIGPLQPETDGDNGNNQEPGSEVDSENQGPDFETTRSYPAIPEPDPELNENEEI